MTKAKARASQQAALAVRQYGEDDVDYVLRLKSYGYSEEVIAKIIGCSQAFVRSVRPQK
jgi:hypothetical protein